MNEIEYKNSLRCFVTMTRVVVDLEESGDRDGALGAANVGQFFDDETNKLAEKLNKTKADINSDLASIEDEIFDSDGDVKASKKSLASECLAHYKKLQSQPGN